MAKGKKNKNGKLNKFNQSIPSCPKPVQESVSMMQNIEKLEEQAKEQGFELSALKDVKAPVENEAELRKRLQSLIETYEKGNNKLEKKELGLIEEEEKFKERKDKFDSENSSIEEDRKIVDADRVELQVLREEINAREGAIQEREADADAGFIARKEQALAKLQAAHQKILTQNDEIFLKAEKRENNYLEKLKVEKEEYLQELSERESKLVEIENTLKEQELALSRKLRDVKWSEDDVEDTKNHLAEHIESKAAQRVTEKDHEISFLREGSVKLRERISEIENSLSEREDAIKTFGSTSPEAVKRQITKLNKRISELEDDLANRPTSTEAEELGQLREQRSVWEKDRATLLNEKGRLEGLLGRLQIEVDALEILRDRNRALLENQRLLKAAVDDLTDDIDKRLDQHRDQPIYPEMLRMDEDSDLNTSPTHFFPGSDDLDLKQFSEDLRHRIGAISNGNGPELYYRPQDIRAFVGGLAMSRLHLLQGISGIGKSSLPRAFAEAVGGFCETVSVQAGWRDKNDLFGYHNAFENKYYESTFLKAMYKAQTPKWNGRPVIILLDEMNLSHPEQYGADILDVLERTDVRERYFELLSFTPKGQHPRFLKNGSHIPLPNNLWFVGTANHDETTKDFAPKTYDRSLVLELPSTPDPFSIIKTQPRPPVACDALMAAFDLATQKYSAEATFVMKWMEENLREELNERFNLGWGGRLETQIKKFIPVVLASGGTVGEALDQVLSSRVLRKITGRHDNSEEDLEAINDILEQAWPDKKNGPESSLKLIAKELRR